jgi:hypothetical protein
VPLYASWVHGNAVTVETPGVLDVGYYGWGGDMAIKPGAISWFHIPIPTPVIVNDVVLSCAASFFSLTQSRAT